MINKGEIEGMDEVLMHLDEDIYELNTNPLRNVLQRFPIIGRRPSVNRGLEDVIQTLEAVLEVKSGSDP